MSTDDQAPKEEQQQDWVEHPPPQSQHERWPDDAPKHPDSAIAGFIVSLIGLLICWIPLLGMAGILGLILGMIPILKRHTGDNKKYSLAIAAVVMGTISGIVSIYWVQLILTSSCPHVYSYDGEGYTLDADPLSGSIFKGAESVDMDRLEALALVDGEYRLKVINERDESDYINGISLHVVDHEASVEVLPTQGGEVIGIAEAATPLRCVDHRQRDQLAKVRNDDNEYFTGLAEDFSPDDEEPIREVLHCTFPRPQGDEAVLVLRAHNSEFAADTFVQYLAEIGPGLGPLLQWAQDEECCPYPDRVRDEMRRLGLPLNVRIGDGQTVEVEPIGPAVFRSQAVVLSIPEGNSENISVQMDMAPLLWEVDQVQLGRLVPVEATVVRPREVTSRDGQQMTPQLTERDDARVALEHGDFVEVSFDAPRTVPEGQRTVVLEISGYYEFEIGGRAWLNPLAILRHNSGSDSLPRFALRRARGE